MFTRPGNWPPGGSTLNCSGDVAPPLGTRGLAALWFITHDGSIVLLYIVTWIPSIYPSHVSTYTSTMDPMGYKRVINHQLCIPGQYLYIYNYIPMLLFLSPTCGFRQVFQGFYPATTYSGWWFQPTPLKNMSSSVGSWDDDIPIYEMESHKIQWFQTTNQVLYVTIHTDDRWNYDAVARWDAHHPSWISKKEENQQTSTRHFDALRS